MEFLDALFVGENVEGHITALPKSMVGISVDGGRQSQAGQQGSAARVLLISNQRGDNLLRRSFLEFLHEADRGLGGLGLNAQMEVLRHEHPTDQPEAGFLTELAQRVDKSPAETRAGKQATAAIGAGGDELQMARREVASIEGHQKNIGGSGQRRESQGWARPAPACRTSSSGATSYNYDALNRLSGTNAITRQDGGKVGISFAGNCATTTDETGKQRTTCTDALGRITSVTEDPSGLNYLTTYTYDALDDLQTVTQGGQARTYNYDMLGRLTSAATPEASNNARSFYYSNSGALCAGDPSAVCIRTDERGITTTYAYDALNRLTSKSYSDGTPTASFAYDETSVTLGNWTSPTLGNPKGRLTHTATTSGSTLLSATIQDYDLMGRPVHYWQCTPAWVCGSFAGQYSYDLAGDLQTWVHPAFGITFTNTIGGAQRATAIAATGNGQAIPESLAPSIHYTPWGAIQTLQQGCINSGCTTVQETYDYNTRMQPVRIQLGTQSNESADYCLVYNFYMDKSNPNSCAVPSPGVQNNGNVMGSWYLDNYTSGFSQTVTNTYDNVNRLKTAVAANNNNYNLTFNYDPYGNMTCVLNGSTNGPCPTYTFNSAYNQISGYTYDAAGNLTNDTTYTYQWDAEGRLSQSLQGTTSIHQYTYNALNQRVQDMPEVQPGNVQDFVYDPSGQMLGSVFSDPVDPGWWHIMVPALGRLFEDTDDWYGQGGAMLHYDALGTAITATQSTTNAVYQDTQYYPWVQIGTSNGGWATGNYAGLYSMQCQFEPCPDQSATRDYPPTLGRWMPPDPLGGDVTNPQSLNRYAYAMNNPTSFVDPTGLDCYPEFESDCGGGEGGCYPGDPACDPGCDPAIFVCGPVLPPGGGGGGGSRSQPAPVPGPATAGSGQNGSITYPCGVDPTGEPLPCPPGNYWVYGFAAAPLLFISIDSDLYTTHYPPTPGCFSVFIDATANAFLDPSLSASTVASFAEPLLQGAASYAFGQAIAVRGTPWWEFGPTLTAGRIARAINSARWTGDAATLERASGVAAAGSLVFAEIHGLQMEWQAAQSGACQ